MELLDFTLTGETTMTEDRLPLNESFYRRPARVTFCVLWPRASCNC